MAIPTKATIQITPDQVKADITNVITVLKALDAVIPNKIDTALVEALQAVEGNEILLTLLTQALGRI